MDQSLVFAVSFLEMLGRRGIPQCYLFSTKFNILENIVVLENTALN